MCVTNFVRRSRPLTTVTSPSSSSNNGTTINNGATATISSRPSLITQRLLNNNSIAASGCGVSTTTATTGIAALPQLLKAQQQRQMMAAGVSVSSSSSSSSSSLETTGSGTFGGGQPLHHHHHPNAAFFPGISSSNTKKTKSKRKRKPQKPGLTAKNNERQFVQHNYHDHALDDDDDVVVSSNTSGDGHEESSEHDSYDDGMTSHDDHHAAAGGVAAGADDTTTTTTTKKRRRGGVSVSFPMKLHAVLEQVEADGLGHVLSWQPHGRCFKIHSPTEFVSHVMPEYFRQSKLTSFQRQLNLYGFSRLTRGADAGSYYHELFLRGRSGLAKRMKRTKVKGTKYKAASNPDAEPDFYKMPPVLPPPQVSDESSSDGGNGDHGSTSETPSFRPVPMVSGTTAAPAWTNETAELEPIDITMFGSQLEPLPLNTVMNQQQQQQPAFVPSVIPNNVTYHQEVPMPRRLSSFAPAPQPVACNVAPAPTPFPVATQQQPVLGPSTQNSILYSQGNIPAFDDHVLEEAVDEILDSGNGQDLNLDFDTIWNDTPQTVDDDQQLGLLLDRFLAGEV